MPPMVAGTTSNYLAGGWLSGAGVCAAAKLLTLNPANVSAATMDILIESFSILDRGPPPGWCSRVQLGMEAGGR